MKKKDIDKYVEARKYVGKIVLQDDWYSYVTDLLDGMDYFPIRELEDYLANKYLGGNGGTVYLEPLTKKEFNSYKNWIRDRFEDDDELSGNYEGDFELCFEECFNDTVLAPTSKSMPDFIELYCDKPEMSHQDRKQLFRDGAGANILKWREDMASLSARWKNRY